MEGDVLKKFALGLLTIAIAGVVAFPGSIVAEGSVSHSKDMPILYATNSEIAQSIYNADLFNASAQLAVKLQGVSDGHSLAYDEMPLYGTNDILYSVQEMLNIYKSNRNQLSDDMRSINDPAAVKVLSMHLKVINSYVTANNYLKKYYNSPTQYNLNMYLKYDENAYDLAVKVEDLSTERYFYHLNKALDGLQ